MATGLGLNSYFGLGDESTIGTGVAATKFLLSNSISLKGVQKRNTKAFLGAASIIDTHNGAKSVSGGIEFPIPVTGAEKILKHSLGGIADSGAGPYTHIYSCTTALPVGISFHVNRDSATVGGTSAFRYVGCQIAKATFKQEHDSMLMLSLDIAGLNWTNVAAETPTYTAPTFFEFSNITTFTFHGIAMSVKSFELTIDNNLATDRTQLGNRVNRGMGRKGQRTVMGKITKEFESITEYQEFLNLSSGSASIVFTNGTNTLTFAMPKTFFRGEDPAVSDSGPIETTMEFEAVQSSAQNDELVVTLVNSTALGT